MFGANPEEVLPRVFSSRGMRPESWNPFPTAFQKYITLTHDYSYLEMTPFALTFETGSKFANVDADKRLLVNKPTNAKPE